MKYWIELFSMKLGGKKQKKEEMNGRGV